MIRVAVAMVAALWLWQCGEKNETTETTDTTEATETTDDCPAAVTAFTSNIQPHVKADSCDSVSCHSSATAPGGFALKADSTKAASNRASMLEEVEEHDKLDADKLWAYLSGDHTGAAKLGGLTEPKVAAWVTAEKACE